VAEVIEQRYDPLKKIEQNPAKEIIPNGAVKAAADSAAAKTNQKNKDTAKQ
jgi:hypothetical protein